MLSKEKLIQIFYIKIFKHKIWSPIYLIYKNFKFLTNFIYTRSCIEINFYDNLKTKRVRLYLGYIYLYIRGQFFFTTTLGHASHNRTCKSWTNWATRLYLICHTHLAYQLPLFQAPLRNFLCEKCFNSQDDAKSAFNDFIASRAPDFYATKLNKLVSR